LAKQSRPVVIQYKTHFETIQIWNRFQSHLDFYKELIKKTPQTTSLNTEPIIYVHRVHIEMV